MAKNFYDHVTEGLSEDDLKQFDLLSEAQLSVHHENMVEYLNDAQPVYPMLTTDNALDTAVVATIGLLRNIVSARTSKSGPEDRSKYFGVINVGVLNAMADACGIEAEVMTYSEKDLN